MAKAKSKVRESAPPDDPTRLSDKVQSNEREDYYLIEIDDINPSPTNPRKHFDEAKLEELAASIREKGILQPILVRPCRTKGHYEIVAGERRYRAAKLAGMSELPCIVRNLSDRAVLEIQCVENDQRADVTPIERARAYKRLVDSGMTLGELAKKVGRSPTTVREDVSLNRLPLPLLEAVQAGKVPPWTGVLVARVPSEKARATAAECVMLGCSDPAGLDFFRQFPEAVLTGKETAELIADHFVRELKGAPFGQSDKLLVPEAGSCKACPKRSGNNRDEYPEGRADTCNDVECYKAKVQAAKDKARFEAKNNGYAVATDEECDEIFGRLTVTSPGWVAVDTHCELLEPRETWRYWFNSHAARLPNASMVMAFDGNSSVRLVVRKSVAMKFLRDHNFIKSDRPTPKAERVTVPDEVDAPLLVDSLDTDDEPEISPDALKVGEAGRILAINEQLDDAGQLVVLLTRIVEINCLDYAECIAGGEGVVKELAGLDAGLVGDGFRDGLRTWCQGASAAELLRALAALSVQRVHEMRLSFDLRGLAAFAGAVAGEKKGGA